MRNDEERRLKRMNRRRVLKAASAFGLGSSSLTFMDQEAIAESITGDEVRYVAYIENVGGKREPVYKRMARDRWNRIKSATNLRDRLQAKLDRRFDDNALTAIFRPMDDSPTGYGVDVNYETTYGREGSVVLSPDPSLEQVKHELPDEGGDGWRG